MYKKLSFSLLLCLFLAACSKQPQPYESFEDAQVALKTLNMTLVQPDAKKIDRITKEQLVFSDAYLVKRHTIYQNLMDMELNLNQIAQVNYLVIAERFPERYFNWPAQVDVLKNMLAFEGSKSTPDNIITWLKLTQDTLDSAKQSNLKLNKIELTLLQSYVLSAIGSNDVQPALKSHIRAFSDYLTSYKPRGSVGLRGLPNGSQWYQSKLNYFSGEVHSPLEWVTILNENIKVLDRVAFDSKLSISHKKSFLVQYLSDEKLIEGLDWQADYQDLPAMASNMNMSDKDKTLMLAMMESDIGIHYHAWTLPQAKVNLMKRLEITQEEAQYLVEDIILYPGQSFSFIQQII
ncbi:MAG: hypothetical protein V7683_10585 [Pseudoalteromonas distincta]|uniref:hypothetical protein n=1 Tax=unclassified Pseudoalteromonas TaxID=194690 RepID=UPI0015F61482|nr:MULTISPECIES: hypothetical protein [unclassified Pseudoalteromonas]MBA6410522.1 hypothetical protein [Pseudoalteromonas sp. 5Ae-yellow]MDN3390920.1 hypothetical protein [Pseudoalteromonas sp. APC 3691]